MNIYIDRGGDVHEGPFTLPELRARVADKRVSAKNLVWQEGLSEWEPVQTFLAKYPETTNPRFSPASIWNMAKLVGWLVLLVCLSGDILGRLSRMFSLSGPSITIMAAKVEWIPQQGGLGGLGEVLWTPKLTVTVRNGGSSELPLTWLRAVFVDGKGTIVGEVERLVSDLPSGRSKGPIFLTCETGYTNELPLLDMASNPKLRWHYELYSKDALGSDWIKLKTAEIRYPNPRDE